MSAHLTDGNRVSSSAKFGTFKCCVQLLCLGRIWLQQGQLQMSPESDDSRDESMPAGARRPQSV